MWADKLAKGSKRRICQIHWKRPDILHAIVLFVLMVIFSFYLAAWLEVHHFD